MDEALAKGDFERAKKLQNAADDVIYAMCSAKGNMYAVAKEVIRKMSGIALGGVREPLLNLQQGDEAVVDKAISLIEKGLAL